MPPLRKAILDDPVKYMMLGDTDKPFHLPECCCDKCEQWRKDNNRPTHEELEIHCNQVVRHLARMPEREEMTNNTLRIELTQQEVSEIMLGLTYRVNMIQTSNPVLSANDVVDGHNGKINPLSKDQMKLLILISELIERLEHAQNRK